MSNKSIFLPQEVIRAKRDGAAVSAEDIAALVRGITDDSVADAQVAAFAMAVFFQGMTPCEGAALTLAMRDSGRVIDWSANGLEKGAPVVDKHSTGGVGDKISLMLAPIVAACGAYVPMISGRGLGHTGGTLDKLEAIPGYNAEAGLDAFTQTVRMVGCSIIGQTPELAPADKRFYAVRDITATVESVPLITASILSKKLAAGLGGLVMDVKVGSGAFMKNLEDARILADNIVRVAEEAGLPTRALVTDMESVLGAAAGNSVEVIESIEFLKEPSQADQRLMDVTLALAAEMLTLARISKTAEEGRIKAHEALHSGKAAEVFGRMVRAHGGPADILENYSHHLPVAPIKKPLILEDEGYLSAMDTRAMGLAIIKLGGGRLEPLQRIDHSVGLTDIRPVGDYINKGDSVLNVIAKSEAEADMAISQLKTAVNLSGTAPAVSPMVLDKIKR